MKNRRDFNLGEAIISRRSVKKSVSGAENNGRSWKNSNLTGISVNSVLGDNGKWVATTQDNGVFYSTDGKNWTKSKHLSDVRSEETVVRISIFVCALFYLLLKKSFTTISLKIISKFLHLASRFLLLDRYADVSGGSSVYYSSNSDGSSWTASNVEHGGCTNRSQISENRHQIALPNA